MKKIIFGIFAHPDDEAFVVAGTLLSETRNGSELHLITLTNGANGTNQDNIADLGTERLKEWHAAGKLLGATTMHHLGFNDGGLNNQDMQKASSHVEHITETALKSAPADCEVEFIAFDLNGITGHIDHIVASRAACLVFYRLSKRDSRLKRIRLACLPYKSYPSANTDWIFMEPGRHPQEVDEIVDARPLHDQIVEVIKTHKTQRFDGDMALKKGAKDLGLNYFIVKTNPGQES